MVAPDDSASCVAARDVALGLIYDEHACLLAAVAHARGAEVRAGDMLVGRVLAGVRAFGHAKLLGSGPGENGRFLRELEDDVVRLVGELLTMRPGGPG